MTTSVKVPDRDSWRQTRHDCLEWLNTTWPGIRWDIREFNEKPNSEYDVQVVAELGYDVYEFQDQQKAMMFKLAWG